jgi:glutathione S-transferase
MLILRSSPASPFGRKVKIAAAICGLSDRIEIVMGDTMDPADSLRSQNPLGKIPILVLEDGSRLYDSRVIVEYLDAVARGGRIIPVDADARFPALTMQALADGLMDALLLLRYEGVYREPAMHSERWLDHQRDKIKRAMMVFEGAPPPHGAVHVGAIALACALSYQDLRFAGRWRGDYPNLVRWLDEFAAAVPAFAATAPPPGA